MNKNIAIAAGLVVFGICSIVVANAIPQEGRQGSIDTIRFAKEAGIFKDWLATVTVPNRWVGNHYHRVGGTIRQEFNTIHMIHELGKDNYILSLENVIQILTELGYTPDITTVVFKTNGWQFQLIKE